LRIVKLALFSFFSFLFSFSIPIPAWSQSNLQAWYRPATHVWLERLPANAPRQIISLNGTWQAASDEPKLAGPVAVPGAFLFEGEMRFAHSFHLADSLRRRAVRLHVNGLNHEAQIVLNNNVIARHYGSYLAFTVDLRNENLSFGQDNTITIAVDNRLSPMGSLPPQHRPFGWRNEGGIMREIYLEVLPEVYLAEGEFQPQLQSDAAQVDFRAQARTTRDLSREAFRNLTVTLEIWDAARLHKLVASAAQPLAAWQTNRHEVLLSCRLPNPLLWSPASPNLYAARVVLEEEKIPRKEKSTSDELWQEIGFRRLTLTNKELRLNGELLTLRGVNWIEEYGDNGALLDTLHLQDLIAAVQRVGANALRVVGHPPHPLLPALCDRAGIFLLEELPFYYLTDAHFRQPRFAALAQTLLAEMVRRDRHHPCVLAWGLGTASLPASPAGQKNVRELAASLRKFDSGFVYAVTPPVWQSFWQEHVDFLLIDWLKRGNLDSLIYLQDHGARLMLPVLGHHAGASEPEDSSSSAPAHGDEMQAEYFTRVLKTLRERPAAGGYFLQSLFDWKGPMPYLAAGASAQLERNTATIEIQPSDWSTLGVVPATRVHPWGIIAEKGKTRPAYAAVQAYNRNENGPSLAVRQLQPEHPGVFQIAGIALILIFLFFLQRDRRLFAGLRRVFVHPHGFYHDLFEHRKVAPFLTVFIGLVESAIAAFLFAQFCYAFRESLVFDQILDLVLAGPSWKAMAIWLIWHPGWFMLWGTLAVFALGVMLGFLFRLLGILFGTNLPLSQYVTAIYWSWANLLLLGALTPVFYRLLLNSAAWRPLLMSILAFKIWALMRVFRAVRVLYMISYFRAALIFLTVFGGLFFAAWLYWDRTRALTEYARYYLAMLRMIG